MNERDIDLRDGADARGAVATDVMDEAALARRIAELEEENAQLRLQLAVFASVDPATGLSNRGGLLDAIDMATFRLARMNEPFAVVMMQFPQLEALTDEEDQLEALRHLGGLLGAGVRSVDQVGRLEDSTFVSVLANIPFEHIDIVLERTRTSLRAVSLGAGFDDDRIAPQVMAVSVTDASTAPAAAEILDRCAELSAEGAGTIHAL